jgi:hypothetical protein
MWGRVRTYLLTFVALLYVAGLPGSVARDVLLELSAPALPKGLEGRDGVLDVFVKDATKEGDDKPPVPRARVHAFAILDGRAHDAGLVIAGDDGHAKLERLPAAEHWIVAEAPGYARASQMVVVVAGARRLDLELAKEHFLEVRVKNEQGAPMDGAEIEVRGGGDPFPVGARTGSDGSARVGRLGEGPYFVNVRALGFEEVQKRRVPEGEVVLVTLSKQGALLVRVVGEDGQPAPGARVLLAAPNLGSQRVAETTKDGTVRIGGLDTGSYTLRAVKGTSVSPIEIGVPVSRGEEKTIELHLAPGVMIVAQVVDAISDDPIAGAKTTLAEGGLSPFPVEGVTDKHGKVILGPIAHGSASLSARADEYVPKSAVRIEDPPSPEVKVALVRGGMLIGKIKDSRGYAVDGATIRVVGTDTDGMPIDEDPQRTSFREAHFTQALAGPSPLIPAGQLGVMPGPVPPIPHGPAYQSMTFGPARSTAISPSANAGGEEGWVSARDGSFTAKPVTPGRVRAYVRHPQYVEAMSEVVTLLPDKDAHVEVVLQRGGILEGKVVDTKGRGVAGVHVTVLATKGSLERMTRTGGDGSFAFAAVPDTLTILVARDEDVSNVVARAEANVPEAGKASVVITLPDVRPALPVRVTDARGTRIEAAQVSAVSLDPSEALRVTAFTDARGEAQLQGAKGLALRIETHAAGKAARVMVTQGESETLVIALGSAESITGEIRNHRGQPLEGATITLHTEGGVRHTHTDRDGLYTLGDLSPGPARMRVRAKGRATILKDVVVEDRGGRKATELPRIELAEEGVVEGVVIDTKGNPVAGARVAKDAVPTYLPVGTQMFGMAVTDAKGRFLLNELAEGNIVIEAYAPDVGRARVTAIPIRPGRTTDNVKITLARGDAPGTNPSEPIATGGVAVTLGETAAGLEGPEVVIVAVSDNSEAERAGLQIHDLVLEIGGKKPKNIVDARAKLSGPVHDDVVVKVKRGERIVTLRVSREQVRR